MQLVVANYPQLNERILNELDSLNIIIDSLTMARDTIYISNLPESSGNWVPIVIALIALVISAYVAFVHERNSRPLLRIDSYFGKKHLSGIKLRNNGTGPAIIISSEIFWDGHELRDISIIQDDIKQWLYANANKYNKTIYVEINRFYSDDAVIVGGDENLLFIELDFETTDVNLQNRIMAGIKNMIIEKLEIKIKYKSLFNKKFNVSFTTNK